MPKWLEIGPDPVRITSKTLHDDERDNVIRQTLELAARRIETYHGNKVYRMAWRTAAKIVRTMKP